MSKQIDLFCFPYAVGNASLYSEMEQYTHGDINVIPFEYSGHGCRMDEEFYKGFNEMVQDGVNFILDHVTENDYAILGYSMGCLVVYEIYYELLKHSHKNPIHLFFLGHRPPKYKTKTKELIQLPKEKFIDELYKLGGMPAEIFEEEELVELVYQKARSDFQLYDSYRYNKKTMLIDSNISIIYSQEDNKNDEIFLWSNYTKKYCSYHKVDGNHFFLHTQARNVGSYINQIFAVK